MENKDIASAKRTIDKEVEALRMMEGELDDTLSKALDVMQNAKGRVIITGMGKSGHIGSKTPPPSPQPAPRPSSSIPAKPATAIWAC